MAIQAAVASPIKLAHVVFRTSRFDPQLRRSRRVRHCAHASGTHRHHVFRHDMQDVTEQIERLAMMVLLLLFGGALVSGLLSAVSWRQAAGAIAIILVIRPITGLIGLAGLKAERSEKLTLASFGIRGVGSICYLAHGLNHVNVADADRPSELLGLIVLFSIVLHGLTVTPIMRSLDRQQGRDPDRYDPIDFDKASHRKVAGPRS